MLEALVSSRIRRTLFEYLLTHPDDRFYLRGLAKALQLSISPLRRELKRLERSGMLQAVEEGNMRFYTINAASPAFVQLRHVGQPGSRLPAEGMAWAGVALAQNPQPRSPSPEPVLVGVLSTTPRVASSWSSPLSSRALIGAAGAGLALMLIVLGLFYLTMTNQRMLMQAARAFRTRKAEVKVIVPPSPASSAMHGARWQLVPGGFGGFSSGANDESY